MKQFYKPKELAEILDLHIMTIWRWIWSKKIRAYKLGKGYRIDEQEFQRLLSKMKIKI